MKKKDITYTVKCLTNYQSGIILMWELPLLKVGEQMAEPIKLRKYSSVREKGIDWLWHPYIPCGKLTLVQGDPGEGKSTFIIQVAACLTRGKPMPDGYHSGGPYKVIYQCAEDDVADTIKPRLIRADADCDMIEFIQDDDSPIKLDDDRIEQAIRHSGARMVVFDPLQAFLPQDGDMQSAHKMRGLLRKLAATATRTNCAIVLIGHMNKKDAGKSLYRGLGSIDIAAIARSILLIERDTNDPTLRYMRPIKSSLAPEGCAVAFTFNPERGFQWVGQMESKRDPSLGSFATKRGMAAQMLIAMLDGGEVESREVFERFEEIGISHRTVQSAKRDLNLEAFRRGGVWYWCKPTSRMKSIQGEEEEDEDG